MIKKLILILAIIFALCIAIPFGYYVIPQKDQLQEQALEKQPFTGIGAYVINLDRSVKRFEYIKPSLDALSIPYERVSGIDGKAINKDEIDSLIDYSNYLQFVGNQPKLGTLGCYMSHLKTLDTFLNSTYKYAVVFEDDVSFAPEKLAKILEKAIQYDGKWDLIMLEVAHNGTPIRMQELSDGHYIAAYLTETSHTGAYLVNREAAQKILNVGLPMKMPIDHLITRSWEFGIKVAGIENPRLVYQTFGTSEINQTEKANIDSMSFANQLKYSIFKLQSYIIRFFYNLMIALQG